MDKPSTPVRTIDDRLTNARYEVYVRGGDNLGNPLLLQLGLGSTVLNSVGGRYAEVLAQMTERPVYAFHSARPSLTWSDFRQRAASDAVVADVMGFDVLDIVGISSGALNATCLAAEMGRRVSHLVTVSSVGTYRGYAAYLPGLPRQAWDSVVECMRLRRMQPGGLRKRSSNVFAPSEYRDLLETARQAVRTSLAAAVGGLSPVTVWRDVVGERDPLTDYRDHIALAEARNSDADTSSSVHVEPGMGHMWATKIERFAQLVREALDEAQPASESPGRAKTN